MIQERSIVQYFHWI